MSNSVGSSVVTMWHRSCLEECPEHCEQQWETYEDETSPWEVDNTLSVTCGKNYALRYTLELSSEF